MQRNERQRDFCPVLVLAAIWHNETVTASHDQIKMSVSVIVRHGQSMHLISDDYSIHINHPAEGTFSFSCLNVNQSPWRQSDCSWQPMNDCATAIELMAVDRNLMDAFVRFIGFQGKPRENGEKTNH